MKTETEKLIENWWDDLSNQQQNWLIEKFYPIDNICTLAQVVDVYNRLTKEDIINLMKIK